MRHVNGGQQIRAVVDTNVFVSAFLYPHRSISQIVHLNIIEDDPPDNRILEGAVEGKANVIVSGDRHLRKLKSYQGIPVVRPVDFLRMPNVI